MTTVAVAGASGYAGGEILRCEPPRLLRVTWVMGEGPASEVEVRLAPGDGVGFPAGTGLCHTFINNTETEVRLLVVGETSKAENRIFYPRNPDRKPLRQDWWDDHPERPLGDHDGMSDQVRDWKAGKRPTQD